MGRVYHPGHRNAVNRFVPNPSMEVAIELLRGVATRLQPDERRLPAAVAVLGGASARTGATGIEKAYLVEAVAVAAPTPVYMVVALAVLYLIAIDDKGMTTACGVSAIGQRTTLTQFVV